MTKTEATTRSEVAAISELRDGELDSVSGARWKRNGVIPGYVAPTVLYDDGINVQTTDPTTSNVAYDSPFTPIPSPA